MRVKLEVRAAEVEIQYSSSSMIFVPAQAIPRSKRGGGVESTTKCTGKEIKPSLGPRRSIVGVDTPIKHWAVRLMHQGDSDNAVQLGAL